MKTTVNALTLRKKFGEIIDMASISGNSVIIERMQKPIAVLVSYQDYLRVFTNASERRHREEGYQLLQEVRVEYGKKKESSNDSTTIIRAMRNNRAKQVIKGDK